MKIIETLDSLSRTQKRLISVLTDAIGLWLVASFALILRLGDIHIPYSQFGLAIVILPVIAIPFFIVKGLYRAVIRYIGYHFTLTVFIAVSMSVVVWAAIIFLTDLRFPRTAIVITWMLALLYVAGTRIFARWLLSERVTMKSRSQAKNIVLFGAGASGQQLLGAINNLHTYRVVGFIDDNPSLQKHDVASIRVYSRDEFTFLIERFDVTELLLAIPSLTVQQRKSVIEWAEPYPVRLTLLPGMEHFVDGKVSFSDVREVDIEDLLGRDPVKPDSALLDACIRGKSVMITGAGGSIGSELCRQAIRLQPKVLILLELSEFALYNIEHELKKLTANSATQVIAVLGNITDDVKVKKLLETFSVETIYHAAAYKHVPIVEHNIREGVMNNSIGTANLANLAAKCKVKNFVLISTDKAVRPTNFMGASKRLAEMALQALQIEYPQTRFVMVRFGNVLGSSGSVIPLFRTQIEQGGPVTVTHKDITRYFMTIPEAASLVIQAGSMGSGGDVFVLDMGEPVKIDQLAKKVIKLSGYAVVDEFGEGDIEIQYTGLRPGEKLYEELLIGDDVDGTAHPRIMTAHEEFVPLSDLLAVLAKLTSLLEQHDYHAVESLMTEVVSGFQHADEIVDYLSRDALKPL